MIEKNLIPEGWICSSLSLDLCFVNQTINSKAFDSKDYITTENMKSNMCGIEPYDQEIIYTKVREYRVEDILLSNIRPYLKKIWFSEKNAGCSTDVLVLRSNLNRIVPKFALQYLSMDAFFIYATDTSTGTKMPRCNKKSLLEYPIIRPADLTEQSRIASALSDVDNLICNLTELIEKKRNIKQGVMQELLSGKRRLPGFDGEWVEKIMGDLCKPCKGSQINKNDLNGDSVGYPVMNGGISPSGYNDKYNVEENTIIISEGGNSCGYVNFMNERFWAGGHCYVISPQEDIDVNYLYQVLKFNEPHIMDLRTGSGLPNIKKSTLNSFSFHVTTEKNEQKAIASVLKDMDSEISILEKRLLKYKDIKQGMMQQLLTGKIRLI